MGEKMVDVKRHRRRAPRKDDDEEEEDDEELTLEQRVKRNKII